MKLKQKYSAGLAIIYNGKILLGHTTGRKAGTGYGIPKGGIEEGESHLDAAIRETREELGIKVNRKLIDKNGRTFAVTSRKYKYNKVVYYYIVNISDLSQIGLKDETISKSKLQLKEIDEIYPKHLKAAEITDYLADLKSKAFTDLQENDLLVTPLNHISFSLCVTSLT